MRGWGGGGVYAVVGRTTACYRRGWAHWRALRAPERSQWAGPTPMATYGPHNPPCSHQHRACHTPFAPPTPPDAHAALTVLFGQCLAEFARACARGAARAARERPGRVRPSLVARPSGPAAVMATHVPDVDCAPAARVACSQCPRSSSY